MTTFHQNEQTIRKVDRFAPSKEPAKPPCWKCHGEGFVGVSKEDFFEYLETRFGVWLGENLEGAKNFIKQFMEFKDEKFTYRRMLPCRECSL